MRSFLHSPPLCQMTGSMGVDYDGRHLVSIDMSVPDVRDRNRETMVRSYHPIVGPPVVAVFDAAARVLLHELDEWLVDASGRRRWDPHEGESTWPPRCLVPEIIPFDVEETRDGLVVHTAGPPTTDECRVGTLRGCPVPTAVSCDRRDGIAAVHVVAGERRFRYLAASTHVGAELARMCARDAWRRVHAATFDADAVARILGDDSVGMPAPVPVP